MDDISSENLERNLLPNYPERFKISLKDLKPRTREFLEGLKEHNDKSSPVIWVKEGFNLDTALEQLPGPVVEVAGPSFDRRLIDFNKLKQPFFVSNINPGNEMDDFKKGEFLEYFGKVDFQADAEKLPFGNEKLGALYAACLPGPVKTEFLSEARRTIKPGGLVILQGLNEEEDFNLIENHGFELVQTKRDYYPNGYFYSSAIFKKPIPKNP